MDNKKLDISTVIFDLDDTILNTKDGHFTAICAFKKLFPDFNNVQNDKFSNLWHQITEKSYDKYLSGKLTFEKMKVERMKTLFSLYGAEISDQEALNRFNIYLKTYEANWILFNDTLELLNNLKDKYNLAIITNGDSEQQRAKIKKTTLDKYFDTIVISSEVKCAKPDKRIYEIACEKINVPLDKCVMIGDRYEIDILGAINSGMHAIWINRRKSNVNFQPQISELTELNEFLL